MSSEKVFLAPFSNGSVLRLVPAQNGGWLVMQEVEQGFIPSILGAFSNAEDMMLALGKALISEPPK